GKVISASRTEVDHIVDHFNIQVDNPVSLLNQDTSRHLLNSNDASDLYKFFMKATSLEQISSDYWSVMENKDIGLALLQKKEQNILDVRAELRRREARFIAVKQIKDVKEQIQELKGERVWAEVIENEKAVSKLATSVEKDKSELPKFDKEIQESEEKINEIDQQIKAKESEINTLKDEAASLKTEQQEIVLELQERKKAVKDKQSTLRQLQRDIREAKNEHSVLQKTIEDLKSSEEMKNKEEDRQQSQQLLEQKTEELKEYQEESEELNNRTYTLLEEEKGCKEQMAKLRQDEDNIRKKIRDKERQIQQVKYRANDRLLKFGDWMPKLVNTIKTAVRDGRFSKPPRGPIGD
ncbi:unnamed protein product, partial [Porites evermanni]